MGRKKLSKVDKVRNYIAKNPDAKPAQIAEATGVAVTYVYSINALEKKRATRVAKRRGRPPKVNAVQTIISTSNTPISPKLVTGLSGKTYEVMDFSAPPPPSLFARITQRIKSLFNSAPR